LNLLNQVIFQFLKRVLDLSNNFLNDIPKDLFKLKRNASLIETLNINKNNLSRLPKEAFVHLTSVKYLYLNDNKFTLISNFSFGYMLNLIELYLANNMIQFIEVKAFYIDEKSYVGPGLLEKLDLSHNRLESINSTIFSYLTNLRYLVLNNNLLKSIDVNSFYGVNYLISLDVSMNQLDRLDFLRNKNFSYMRYLKLSHNRLEYINASAFANLKSLKQLDLSSNKIRGLSDCAFYGIQETIKKITLNYNNIRLVDSCSFMLGFRYMRIVQMLHNPLNCLNNCEFFYSIYNPPYSIDFEGTECINGAVSGFNCNLLQYERINEECKRRLAIQNCPNSNSYIEFEMREFQRQKSAKKLFNTNEQILNLQEEIQIYETSLVALENKAKSSYKVSSFLHSVCILLFSSQILLF
jgi:hypothetical protein